MPEFHYVTARANVNATEDRSRVLTALRSAVGNPEAEVTDTHLTGYHGNPLTRLEHEVKRKKDVDAFFAHLAQDPALVKTLHRQLDARLDDHGIFYLRVDKQAAFAGRLKLAFDENTIQFRVKVRAYPSNRGNALAQLEAYFDELVAAASRGPPGPVEEPGTPPPTP